MNLSKLICVMFSLHYTTTTTPLLISVMVNNLLMFTLGFNNLGFGEFTARVKFPSPQTKKILMQLTSRHKVQHSSSGFGSVTCLRRNFNTDQNHMSALGANQRDKQTDDKLPDQLTGS